MGWTTNLLTGCAMHLQTAGAGVWRPPPGAYVEGETGILIRHVPPAPDRIITLAAYPVDHARGMADITIGVQIRVRGLPRQPTDCDDLADAIFDALDSIGRQTWAGVPIVDCWRQSHTSLGFDGNGRWERSENYYVEAMRPTANNTD